MFKCAIPVFAEGKCDEMNVHLTLRARVDSLEGTKLCISAFSFYRLWVNGEFVFFGPTRAAVGYARVNELDLGAYNKDGGNELKIEVVGYNCSSLTTVNQPSFVIAELRRGDDVLLATGRDFEGFITGRKIQKVERYSVQRHFEELWDMTVDAYSDDKRVKLTRSENDPVFLSNSAPAPYCADVAAKEIFSVGEFTFDESLPVRMNRYSWKTVDLEWGKFDESEIELFPHRWIQQQSYTIKQRGGKLPLTLREGEYALIDMGMIYAGFITFSAEALESTDLIIGYSELCESENFEFSNINCQNVFEYFLPEGFSDPLMSFEPYTCKTAVVMVKKGALKLNYFGMKTFEFDTANIIKREIRDPELKKIYDAAIRTFCHNIVDIYMDCPSRERAGWLGDSFFIGKVEHFLTGKSAVEDIFLENYRLCKTKRLPKGVLPECYPSDFEGNFIPQWNLWYILEVCEYLEKRNTSVDKEIFRESVYGILDFFAKYENENGMAQNLPSWNFVEWSKANEWVQDLSYPTNFLYAEAMRQTGRIFGDDALIEKSDKLRAITRELSFNGEIFIDNAVLDENKVLRNTENFSEAGQYYAILFGDVNFNEQKYAKLKEHILNNFSAFDPEAENFVPVNVFIGFLLKLLVFMDYGMMGLLRETIKSFFGPMVDATGTIWEYKFKQRKGSYDHGFSSLASIVAYELDK